MSSRASSSILMVVGSILAIVAALLVGAIVILASGHDPFVAYKALAEGALGSRRGRAETLVYAAPLLLGGLAFAVAARAGMFNIGIEGQLVMGGFAAALIGTSDWHLPGPVQIVLAMLAAIIAGGIWGAIPGFLRAVTGAHEVITTIMLNYLAFRLITYLIQKRSDWLPVDPQIQGTNKVLESARLPILLERTRLHLGIIIAFVVAIIIWYVLFHTVIGYKIRTVGLSTGAARYGGINWGLTVTLAMALSGALAGIAGAGESLGLHGRHSATPPGLGFTAIAVGLVGRNNPIGIIFAALLFGFLSAGAPSMQASAGVSREIVLVIQGLVILAVAAFEAINRLSWFRQLTAPPATTGGDRSSAVGMEPEVEPRPSPPVI